MSITKSILPTILCDYVPLYEYRGRLLFLNDLKKIKVLKKKKL